MKVWCQGLAALATRLSHLFIIAAAHDLRSDFMYGVNNWLLTSSTVLTSQSVGKRRRCSTPLVNNINRTLGSEMGPLPSFMAHSFIMDRKSICNEGKPHLADPNTVMRRTIR